MPTSRPIRLPHGLRCTVLAGIVAALVGSLLVAPAPTAAATSLPAGPAGPPVPRLHWAPCGDGLECTTAQVPLDYDQPSGATISLALIRLPADDPSRRIGSIFINPGAVVK